jgi:hypothetical protein
MQIQKKYSNHVYHLNLYYYFVPISTPTTISTPMSISTLKSLLQSSTMPPSPIQHFDNYTCTLCGKLLKSKATLRNHENKFHKFNRLIPHFPVLSSPNDIEILKQCIVINIQNRLGFNRHGVGFKRFILEPFPENILLIFFLYKAIFLIPL